MRCGAGVEGQLPEGTVAFVDEVGDGEPLAGELLHVVGKRAHAGEDLLALILRRQAGRHCLSLAAVRRVQLGFDDQRPIHAPRWRLDQR
jgi:hypothetical protein